MAAFVPPAVVTNTLAVPAKPDGIVAVILVEEATTTLVAALPRNVTLVAPVRFVPVITTLVPPAVNPELGLIDVIVGAADAGAAQPVLHGVEPVAVFQAELVETVK